MTVISQFHGEYHFLSNFYEHQITKGDITYKTNEHFYQAHKSKKRGERLTLSRCATPAIAKRMGRRLTLRKDWDAVKYQIMLDGLRKKFKSPTSKLGKLLLATGDAMLIEGNTWGDQIWGATYNLETDKFTGQNWLGSLLMVRRAELRSRLVVDDGPPWEV